MSQFSINQKPKNSKNTKSLILWGFIIIISIAGILISVVPSTMKVLEQKQSIQEFSEKENKLSAEIRELEESLANKKSDFLLFADESLQEENKLLPDTLDIENISKSLEAYSLVIDFEISNLSFGSPAYNSDLNVQILPLNIVFNSSEKKARDFIKYLQSNKIPTVIERESNRSELKTFIINHPLPLATIQTINLGDAGEDGSDEKTTTLQVNLHGKPKIETNTDQ